MLHLPYKGNWEGFLLFLFSGAGWVALGLYLLWRSGFCMKSFRPNALLFCGRSFITYFFSRRKLVCSNFGLPESVWWVVLKLFIYLGFQIYYTELYKVFSNGVFQFSVYLFLFWMFVLSPFFFFFFKLSKLVLCLLISSKTRFFICWLVLLFPLF